MLMQAQRGNGDAVVLAAVDRLLGGAVACAVEPNAAGAVRARSRDDAQTLTRCKRGSSAAAAQFVLRASHAERANVGAVDEAARFRAAPTHSSCTQRLCARLARALRLSARRASVLLRRCACRTDDRRCERRSVRPNARSNRRSAQSIVPSNGHLTPWGPHSVGRRARDAAWRRVQRSRSCRLSCVPSDGLSTPQVATATEVAA